MTRREAREHCFKMLFCQDFYPAEEKVEQIERYFDAPIEDETTKEGFDSSHFCQYNYYLAKVIKKRNPCNICTDFLSYVANYYSMIPARRKM